MSLEPELAAIRDAADHQTRRELSAAYVQAHPEVFTDLEKVALEACVHSVSVFRAAGMEREQWWVEAWIAHHFGPQQVSGEMNLEIELPTYG